MKIHDFFRRSELTAALWALRPEFTAAIVFTVVVNVLMLTPTLYMLQVFDRVLMSYSAFTLGALTLVMLFFFMCMSFSEWMRSRLLVRTGVKLDAQLNSRVFKASFERHLRQSGESPAQAFGDLINVRQFLTGNGLFAFMDAPWTPIYILVLFLLHPLLGLTSIVFSLILMGVAYFSGQVMHEPLETASEAGLQVNAYLHNKLKNAAVVESMGMLGDLRRLWMKRQQRFITLNQRAQDTSSRVQALTKFVSYAQQSLALGVGALLVIEGELSPGAMIAANVLMGRATQPLSTLVSTWKATLAARDAFLRLETLLEQNPPRPIGLIHEAPTGHVRLERLVATAQGRAEPILKQITAEFPAGAVIGVVGPSGSGKSTLARSLVGIWPFVQGKVLLDGEPIESWERDELGPYIGYLPQDVELFDGSIAENVARFGEVAPDKVIEACKRAGVHDMILRFSRGYDSPMGEAGSHLSGGQRQRIGLARALYGDPSLVVLDEPNANLDEAGELALLGAVRDLKQRGKTVFLITHRRNIIGVTDHLMVLQDGVVLHYGATKDVIAKLQTSQQQLPPATEAVAQPA